MFCCLGFQKRKSEAADESENENVEASTGSCNPGRTLPDSVRNRRPGHSSRYSFNRFPNRFQLVYVFERIEKYVRDLVREVFGSIEGAKIRQDSFEDRLVESLWPAAVGCYGNLPDLFSE